MSFFPDAPIAISFPHFLYGDDEIHNYIDGFTPNVEDHQSYVILEPVLYKEEGLNSLFIREFFLDYWRSC